MRNKKSTTFLFFGLALMNFTQITLAEMPGFYVSAQAGYATSNLNTENIIHVYPRSLAVDLPKLNNKHIAAYRLSFGYQFNNNYSVEIGYHRFRKVCVDIFDNQDYFISASSKESAVDLMGKALFPLTQALCIYTKAGITHVKISTQGFTTQIKKTSHNLLIHPNIRSFEPTFTLGASYALKNNIPIDFSWNRKQKINSHSVASSNFYALGLSYYFG